MTLYRNINGKRVKMSAEEEAETRAEWAVNAAKSEIKKPRPDIKAAIQAIIDGDMVAAQEAMDKME